MGAENGWNWPASTDAVLAVPESHWVLFENDDMRARPPDHRSRSKIGSGWNDARTGAWPLFTHGLAQQRPWCDVPHADECVRLALNSPASNGAAEFAARPLSVSTGLLFFLQPWLRLYFEIPVIGVNRHEDVMQEAF